MHTENSRQCYHIDTVGLIHPPKVSSNQQYFDSFRWVHYSSYKTVLLIWTKSIVKRMRAMHMTLKGVIILYRIYGDSVSIQNQTSKLRTAVDPLKSYLNCLMLGTRENLWRKYKFQTYFPVVYRTVTAPRSLLENEFLIWPFGRFPDNEIKNFREHYSTDIEPESEREMILFE